MIHPTPIDPASGFNRSDRPDTRTELARCVTPLSHPCRAMVPGGNAWEPFGQSLAPAPRPAPAPFRTVCFTDRVVVLRPGGGAAPTRFRAATCQALRGWRSEPSHPLNRSIQAAAGTRARYGNPCRSCGDNAEKYVDPASIAPRLSPSAAAFFPLRRDGRRHLNESGDGSAGLRHGRDRRRTSSNCIRPPPALSQGQDRRRRTHPAIPASGSLAAKDFVASTAAAC